MRPAGRFVADVLTALKEKAAVGVNLLELDELAHDMIRRAGATSCYIDYHPSFGASPFGKVLCTSVNDAVLHGLPHDYTLVDGDLISVDFAASVDGWVADSALSVVVGTPRRRTSTSSPLPRRRSRGRSTSPSSATRSATSPPRSARWQRRAAAAQHRLRRARCRPHHARRAAHPERRPRQRGLPLRPGLVIAIEPWFMLGTDKIYTDPDGWTLRSADGSRGAHSEHTIAITHDGPIVLTARTRTSARLSTPEVAAVAEDPQPEVRRLIRVIRTTALDVSTTVREHLLRQAGTISNAQARSAGLSPRQIDHKVATGEWLSVRRGVYRLAAAVPLPETGLWAGGALVGA